MEVILKFTITALLNGVHAPPAIENDPPFPLEHEGRMEFLASAEEKEIAYVFKLNMLDPINFSVRRADRENESFIDNFQTSEQTTMLQKGFVGVFQFVLPLLEQLWESAVADRKFYAECSGEVEVEVGENNIPLVMAIFQGNPSQ